MMGILDKITSFFSGISPSQFSSLVICIIAVSVAASAAKKVLSILLSIAGLLAALYFIAPDLYQTAFELLTQGVTKVSDFLQ